MTRETYVRHLPCGLGVLLLALTFSGCIYPKIANREWEYIRVVYMVRERDKLKPQSWQSADATLLNRLHAAFPTGGNYVVSPKPHLSTVNRIDVKLHGGQWWCLAYFPDSADIGIVDPSKAKNTFLLVESNPETFYGTLTNEIMKMSGIAVNLRTEIRSYEEMEKLGNNHAAYYERYIQAPAIGDGRPLP